MKLMRRPSREIKRADEYFLPAATERLCLQPRPVTFSNDLSGLGLCALLANLFLFVDPLRRSEYGLGTVCPGIFTA